MALDSRYITSVDLSPYLVDKSTGAPLANGYIEFWQDDNRNQPKDVFQLVQGSGSPPNYSYAPLPNPLTLSAVGTIQNSGGDNVALYYFPFDEFDNVQLYYVKVYDSGGLLQFTREAWPNSFANGSDITGGSVGFNNQLTNPQFGVVNFISGAAVTVPYVSGTNNFPIGPGWTLNIIASGSGTLTVTQTPIVGQSAYPYNPPFTLDIVAGSGISTLNVIQTLNHNPDWAAPQIANVAGFLSGSILLGAGTTCSMKYVPSAGNGAQIILNETNNTGAYAQFTGTIELDPANNPQNGSVGYDQIVLTLSNTGTSSISNVQVIPLTSNISGVQYDQTPSNRQLDYMFNYYNSLLQAKPVASYLVGWDFPQNPAQPLGPTIAAFATGVNTSNYVWDQTIVYQSANSAFTTSRDASGALKITAAVDTQIALIQYIPAPLAREVLGNRLSVNVAATTDNVSGLVATSSLWYMTGALPSTITSKLSIVATLDANGKPATFNGTWVEVPRLPVSTSATTTENAKFTIASSSTANSNDYGFSGWDMQGAAVIDTATFVAIVVGTATLSTGKALTINSISLVPGDFATRPAPLSEAQTLLECSYYYASSFDRNIAPASGTGLVNGYIPVSALTYGGIIGTGCFVTCPFPSDMYAVPTTVTTYNPVNNNNKIYNTVSAVDFITTNINSFNVGYFNVSGTTGGSPGLCAVNYTADARLGQ